MTKNNLKLITLRARNFKGIEDYTLDTNGENVRIYGDNATGKTTISDAFHWLLHGKDSQNKADFEIKPLDENGEVAQHGINNEVEGVFMRNDELITLKRVFKEKWIKKHGTANKIFDGHTTDYFIDEVPVKKKQYEEKVSEIISEDVFKLLTNPLYFNQQLGWKARRDILLALAGEVTPEDVAETSNNKDLAALVKKLNGRDIEDHKKVIRSKQKAINDELTAIPVRIDEIKLSQPDISGLDKAALESKAADLDQEIEAKQSRINDIRSGGEVSNKRRELSDIELELSNIKNEHSRQQQDGVYRKKASIQENESNIMLLKRDKETHESNITLNNKRLADMESRRQELKQEWYKENGKEFKHEAACECPTCGQELPESQVNEAKEKALEAFNINKGENLEAITKKGKHVKAEIDRLNETTERDQRKIETLNAEIEKKEKQLAHMQEELQSLELEVTDIKDNPQYQNAMQQKEQLENDIKQLQSAAYESINAVEKEIFELRTEKQSVQKDLNNFDVADRSKARLAELEDKEKQLAQEFEQLEKELYLIDEYTRKKVNLMEERINNQFQYATFKLFDQQINGGLRETCETLYDGVPFNGGLNNAAKINVGLDIINTLNRYYGVTAPIFIDNSESVTRLIDIDAQLISLVVSEMHKHLEKQTA